MTANQNRIMQTALPIAQLLPTAIQALTTPPRSPMPLNQKFADWLGFQTHGDLELIKAATAAQEWASAFKTSLQSRTNDRSGVFNTKEGQDSGRPRWLSIIGKSGTGKTHICKRLWFYAKEKSDWSRFNYFPKVIFWPDFIQTLRAGDAFEMRQEMKRWPVLFLDDIGAERDPTGFAAEELNTLLGCRIDRWTLITSNKDAEGIKAIDGRIFSRLIRGNNICVGIDTKDYSERTNQ